MSAALTPAVTLAFRWLGALLFGASLAFCGWTYAVTMGRPAAPGSGTVGPLLVDTLLFTGFALHHSLFARERVRSWIRRVTADDLERSVYVWVASALLAATCAAWQPVAGTIWQADGAARWLLHGLQLAGLWLTVHSAAIIDVLDLAGVRLNPTAASAGGFRVAGPYAWVRHPIYTGWFLLVFAAPTMTATRFVFATLSAAYLLVAIPLEERSLRAAAGDTYDQYARRVRWKLVPWLH